MIDPAKFESGEFKKIFEDLENTALDELENMVLSQLIEQKVLRIYGLEDETLEFAGRTNFKLRLKRPNKNVWSISLKALRDALRLALRQGKLPALDETVRGKVGKKELPMLLLLHAIPNDEVESRSFVGNKVIHEILGEGKIVRISQSGNVEIQFNNKTTKLKPGFVILQQKS